MIGFEAIEIVLMNRPPEDFCREASCGPHAGVGSLQI
jgi:hypothetical protein